MLTPEEQLADKLRLKKLHEESDLELAKETFGVNNTVYGIDAMNPSSRDDLTEFGKLLKDKITQYEKSLYYADFLEALVRDVCISLGIDDLKKITNSLTVLCSEKQKQEKVRERAGWKVCATDTGVDTAPPRRLVRGSWEFTDAVYIGREQERECRGHPLFIDIFMFF